MDVLDDRVVGYVYYEDFKGDGYSDICFLNVLPSVRNRRIGTMLAKKAIEDSFQKSYIKKVEISVRVNNPEAFRLYQRLGFQETITFMAYKKQGGPLIPHLFQSVQRRDFAIKT